MTFEGCWGGCTQSLSFGVPRLAQGSPGLRAALVPQVRGVLPLWDPEICKTELLACILDSNRRRPDFILYGCSLSKVFLMPNDCVSATINHFDFFPLAACLNALGR